MTTTTKSATLVRPVVGDLVHIAYSPDHRAGGKVTAVDAGSFDVEKYVEWVEDEQTDYDDGDPDALATLYDVEQADTRCVVTVLS
jgi:hypothetical protein